MHTPSSPLAVRLAPQLPDLRLDHIQIAAESISIRLTATAAVANCPLCGTPSNSIHSAYSRIPADLPWAGYTVSLQLVVRKFFCKSATCSRHIFTERLPQLLAPHARRTARLSQIISLVAYALGGQAGARLIGHLGMPVSASTLLRLIRRTPERPVRTPRVLGLDDFAFRKGRSYGTILVDHEQHRPVDLLPDRTAATLATWLREHPGVEVITRDRSTEYIRGATLGAPQARQIADRFHLVGNLREALERLLDRNRSQFCGFELPHAGLTAGEQEVVPAAGQRRPAPRTATESTAWQIRRAAKQVHYEQVRSRHAAGASIRSIAGQLGLSRGTVYRYLRSDSDPTATRIQSKPSRLDAFVPYLYARWQAGCDNGVQLWRELKQQGYPGSRKMVAVWVAQQRQTPAKTGPRQYQTPEHRERKAQARQEQTQRAPSAKRLSYFLLRDPQELNLAERAAGQKLQELSADVAASYPLVQEFLQMVRKESGAQLEDWLAKVAASSLEDLQSFAAGLARDKAAVLAGLVEDWSNGPVEGQVNRLKLKKREMYGRAKFDLLRRRVLDAA